MRYLLLALLLFACTTVPVTETPAPLPVGNKPEILPIADKPVDAVGPAKGKLDLSGCPAKGTIQAVDLSLAVDQKFLDHMKAIGVSTIIRYSDYYPSRMIGSTLFKETISGKVPRQAEIDLIAKNGMRLILVHQHNNSSLSSFTAWRGKEDAEQFAMLAPKQAVWLYGVDFDASAAQQASIEAYAAAFKKVADKYGKTTGAYGSGRTLSNLFAKKLISYKWISQSTGFGGTRALTDSGQWHMLQKLPNRKCGGKEFDPNIVKEAQ